MTLTQLRRYSKPRGLGDQTSGGRGKLLRATTALSRIELVVRETLQNSWDARDDEWYPAYGTRIYHVDDRVRDALRHNVFTDLPDSMGDLAESLSAPGLHVLEIFDRGTSGLDGPYRASEVAAEGEPNNFNSFVADIGTTKASDTSGGTYGFGKTATFEVSRAHSVVYWSRCRGADGELEYRLIAASLHEPYDAGGARYTGAHWWGDPEDEDVIPLRGDRAKQLGEQLFRTHFGDDDETGTSIMIIDPVISISSGDDTASERAPVRSDEHADLLTEQITEALAYSAWPKTIPTDGISPPMILKVHKNDVEQNVAADIRTRYRRFADALIEVRRKQGQQEDDEEGLERPANIIREETFPIRLRPGQSMSVPHEEIFGARKDKIAGHLRMVANVKDPAADSDEGHHNALCLMRSNAELVVRYDSLIELEDDHISWHAVFKPTPECDRHFAAAEPPTHDHWNPASAENEVSTYVVEKTLKQIREKARRFLEEHRARPIEGQRSVRAVATGLSSFVPFNDEHEEDVASPRRRARTTGGSRSSPRASVDVTGAQTLPGGGGQRLRVRANAKDKQRLRAVATIYSVTADERLPLDGGEIEATWFVDGSTVASGLTAELDHGTSAELELRTRAATALDIDIRAEEDE